MVASVVAVIGTLLGSTVTYVFQRLNAGHAERRSREERLRQERIAAYSDLAGAVTEWLRANISLWFMLRRSENFGAQARREAYTEADRLGAAASHARFRVQMLAADPELLARAEATFEPMDAVRAAADRDELDGHAGRCHELVKAFIDAASREVR